MSLPPSPSSSTPPRHQSLFRLFGGRGKSVAGSCPDMSTIGFRVYYLPIMENQMEKKMENEMETGGNIGIKELKLSYHNL